MRIPIAIALLAACGSAAQPPQPLSSRASEPVRAMPALASVEWSRTRSDLGFELASFAGTPVEGARWNIGGVAMQGAELAGEQASDKARLRWLVRTGAGESLDGFRRDHDGWTFTAGPAITVCSQRVVPVIATKAAEAIECVMTETGNHPAWIPPRRAMAIQLEHRGLPVVASFEIEAEHVDAWQSAATEFFAAMHCL